MKKKTSTGRKKRIIGFLAEKAGVGKSTLALTMAEEFARRGMRVRLLDADYKNPSCKRWAATASAQNLPVPFVVDALQEGGKVAPWIEAAKSGAQAEDLLFIDVPGARDPIIKQVAAVADVVLVPIAPSPFEVWQTEQTNYVLSYANEARQAAGLAPCKVLAIVNRTELDEQDLTQGCLETLAADGLPVLGLVRRRKAFRKEIAEGHLLGRPQARHARADIVELVNNLEKELR